MIESSQATTLQPDAVAHTTTLIGLDAVKVSIEVSITSGPARFTITSLDTAAEREAIVRVSAALASMGVSLQSCNVTVRFAGPTSHHGSTDLAIALAILAALGVVRPTSLQDIVVLGELSLSGDVRPIRGALAHVLGARTLGYERAIVPASNGNEAGAATGMSVYLATRLRTVVAHLNGETPLPVATAGAADNESATAPSNRFDLADIHGLGLACRVLEIAAAGNHNLLLIGPLGSGKTLLARRLPTILPPLTDEEAITVTMIHSVAGLLPADARIVRTRPFRAPHHTVSETGLLGGGKPIRPGELSLAHHGVLFLDDLPEFRRSTLDALPAILERGDVILRRSGGLHGKFPAQPLLVASAEPCLSGHHRQVASCDCPPERVAAYRARLAALTLRTFDLHVTLPSIDGPPNKSSAVVRERVSAARAARTERGSGRFNTVSASLDAPSAKLIADAAACLKLCAAAYSKVLRVARTIADLDGSTPITSAHMDEALTVSIVSPFAQAR